MGSKTLDSGQRSVERESAEVEHVCAHALLRSLVILRSLMSPGALMFLL